MKTLICIPTQLEQDALASVFSPRPNCVQIICGFGLVAAGIGAMQALCADHFSEIILVGCAGSYDLSKYPVGSAYFASELRLDGIGVGSANNFSSLAELGWGEDTIKLSQKGVSIVSVCSSSANEAEASWRKSRFPNAALEEMEGYAVALAAKQKGIHCTVIRGVSNQVGVRTGWKIELALQSAATLLQEYLHEKN